MYAIIHRAICDMAQARLGQAEWERLVATNGFALAADETDPYATMALARLLADRLATTGDEMLYLAGRHWAAISDGPALDRYIRMHRDTDLSLAADRDIGPLCVGASRALASLPDCEITVGSNGFEVRYSDMKAELAPFAQGVLSAMAEKLGESVTIDYLEQAGSILFEITRIVPDAG